MRWVSRCLQFLRPHWQLALGAYLTSIGIILFNILMPQLVRWIIDSGIRGHHLRLLAWACLALTSLGLGKGFLVFLQGQWSEVASQNVAYDVRNRLQRNLTLLSFSYHDQSEAGQLLSRTIQDVERIRFLTGRAILRIFEGALMLVATLGVLWWMNARLAPLFFAAAPLMVYLALSYGSQYRPLSLVIQKQLGSLTGFVEQTLRGIQVVKTFAREEDVIAQFDRQNESLQSTSIRAARLQAVNLPLLFLAVNLGIVLIILYGGRLVIQGELTLGEMVAFTTYLSQLIEPVRRLGMVIPAVVIASSAAERVFEVLDSMPEVRDAPGARPMSPIQGHVRFQDVHFTYGRQPILQHIDFEARPGEVIALLGATGAGKTSLVHLIPRFYDPSKGRILIDGVDIRQVRLNTLRSQIGIVMQETNLFATTVRENIAFGDPHASLEEIITAARAAQAHDFIQQMPNGYDTRIGEKGMTLSGGQKQRLAIARSILLNPHILILDDATSSVDAETEHAIRLAIEQLIQGRTTFIIAHRLSSVQRADRVLVMEHGQIVAQGKHGELLSSSPVYQHIYRSQLAGPVEKINGAVSEFSLPPQGRAS